MYSSGCSKMSKPRYEDRSDTVYPDCKTSYSQYEKNPVSEYSDRCETRSNGISEKILSFIKDLSFDDVLIIAVFILLLNENKQDDYLILLILAVLFFS